MCVYLGILTAQSVRSNSIRALSDLSVVLPFSLTKKKQIYHTGFLLRGLGCTVTLSLIDAEKPLVLRFATKKCFSCSPEQLFETRKNERMKRRVRPVVPVIHWYLVGSFLSTQGNIFSVCVPVP